MHLYNMLCHHSKQQKMNINWSRFTTSNYAENLVACQGRRIITITSPSRRPVAGADPIMAISRMQRESRKTMLGSLPTGRSCYADDHVSVQGIELGLAVVRPFAFARHGWLPQVKKWSR